MEDRTVHRKVPRTARLLQVSIFEQDPRFDNPKSNEPPHYLLLVKVVSQDAKVYENPMDIFTFLNKIGKNHGDIVDNRFIGLKDDGHQFLCIMKIWFLWINMTVSPHMILPDL
ncbi:Arginosuc synth domain containing protein [Asbolus verrucosus]|uniref:Arginosuc synth domain containing protein n=1 Tax=Asbolus verrucosus TaxID=1661398 RepID=A0A482WE19_ASBVE|nr:Arginosuc synth domain containing protein [Asbolus verrucosus]